MSSARRAVGTALLVFGFVACGLGSPGAAPVEGMMVIVSTHGVDCQGQGCGDTVVIERDGTVRQAAPIATELGTMPNEVRAALEAAIQTTHFDAVRAQDWEGECGAAGDGILDQVDYEFVTPGGIQRVSTCRTEVDSNHPLFAALEAALSAVGRRAP